MKAVYGPRIWEGRGRERELALLDCLVGTSRGRGWNIPAQAYS
jgi:hypothetical protein